MSCPSGSQVNVALMELVGFNARQVEEGLTKRGDAQRKTKPKQGPLSAPCLADNISKLSREQMESLFNQMVESVVGCGLLDGERIVALDGSKLETPKTYEAHVMRNEMKAGKQREV